MNNDTALPHQRSHLIHKKGNPIWKLIFILLFIINIVFFFWAGKELNVGGHTEHLSGFVVIFFSLPLAIIDLIVVLIYVFIHRPLSRVSNIMSTSIFFALSFLLITVSWTIGSMMLGINPNLDIRLEYATITIVTALLSSLFFRHMSYK